MILSWGQEIGASRKSRTEAVEIGAQTSMKTKIAQVIQWAHRKRGAGDSPTGVKKKREFD